MTQPRQTGRAEMDISKVRELVKLVEESGIEELEVIHEDTTIRIQKSAAMNVSSAAVHTVPAPVAAPAPAPASAAAAVDPAPAAVNTKWKDLRSPIVGTFYRAASPTSPSFVNVGDHVSVGQPLCIIEAMKVMNEIKADVKGVIKKILVDDTSPVQYGQPLFLVEPK